MFILETGECPRRDIQLRISLSTATLMFLIEQQCTISHLPWLLSPQVYCQILMVVTVMMIGYVDLQDVPKLPRLSPMGTLGNGCETDMPTGRTHLELS